MMKRNKINLICLLVFTSLVMISCDFFKAGSYANAEYYSFDTSCDSLISRIKQFKSENLEYNIFVNDSIKKDYVGLNNFYKISFYFKDENIIVYNVINMYQEEGNSQYTNIGWNSILDNVGTDSAKFIQVKELPKTRRDEIRKKYESEILDKLGEWRKN